MANPQSILALSPLQVERFWSKVDKSAGIDGCWLWTGAQSSSGYGNVGIDGRYARAHRIAWALAHGPIPFGMFVCHNCPDGDNPLCVNPSHLFLGTPGDNTADMWAKGRGPSGERNGAVRYPERVLRGEQQPSSKLKAEQVRQIRQRYAVGGVTQQSLADEYGVTFQMISRIIKRIAWAHLDDGTIEAVLR